MAAQWYYAKGGQQLGPVATEELRALLRSGDLKAADLVWKDGMPDWSPAGTVSILKTAKTPSAEPKPKAVTSAPQRVGATPDVSAAEPAIESAEPGLAKGPGFVSRAISSTKQFSQRFSTKQKLVVGGGLAGLVVLAIVLLWWFTPSSGGFANHKKYAPNKSVAVVYIDLEQILASEFYKKLDDEFDREVRKGIDQMDDQFKIKPQDISSISIWVNVDEFPQFLAIVRTRTAMSDEVYDNVEDMQAEKEEIGGIDMHTLRTRDSIAVAFPTNMTALIGAPQLIEDILERGRNSPKFSSTMQAALNRTDFKHSITFVGDLNEARDLLSEMPGGSTIQKYVGPFVSHVDISNAIRASFTVLKSEADEPLISLSGMVDAVAIVEMADSIQRTAERRRDEEADDKTMAD